MEQHPSSPLRGSSLQPEAGCGLAGPDVGCGGRAGGPGPHPAPCAPPAQSRVQSCEKPQRAPFSLSAPRNLPG